VGVPCSCFYNKEVSVAKKKYVEVLTRLRTAKFIPIWEKPSRQNLEAGMERMRDNLWSMFRLKYTPEELKRFHETSKFPFGSNCADYAWTDTVREKFYSHPYHIHFHKFLRKRKDMTWGMWSLQVEPAEISDEDAKALTKTTRRNR
jgi:hypothetical protein